MPFAESLTRLMTSLAAMLHGRMELATIEIEEESLRLYSTLMLSLLALFCGTFALALMVVLCIVLFWEQHRIAVLLGFTVLFALACLFLVRLIRQQYRNKPPLLSSTLGEIRKDIDALKPPAGSAP